MTGGAQGFWEYAEGSGVIHDFCAWEKKLRDFGDVQMVRGIHDFHSCEEELKDFGNMQRVWGGIHDPHACEEELKDFGNEQRARVIHDPHAWEGELGIVLSTSQPLANVG